VAAPFDRQRSFQGSEDAVLSTTLYRRAGARHDELGEARGKEY